jgi:hypothetical protein
LKYLEWFELPCLVHTPALADTTQPGSWRLCNTLLSRGADPTLINTEGDLAVDIAYDSRTESVLQAGLEEKGFLDKV